MSHQEPQKKTKAQVFGARLFSTLLLWAIVTGVFLSGSAWAFITLMMLMALFGTWEYFQMTQRGGMPSQPKWGMVVSLVYLLVIGWKLGTGGNAALDALLELDVAFVLLVVMGGFVCQLRRAVDGKNTVTEVAVTTLGFIYVAVMFSFLPRLLFVPDGAGAVPGAWLVIWLTAVTKFADMGAYITGSLIGKHKMIPHISPGKTWQGFFGGLAFSQLAGCGLFALLPEQLSILGGWGWVIGLSLLLSLLAIVGDLAESVLKRSIGVKDSGNTLPGIGGALDLIDSLCFTAPVLYFVLRWIPHCAC
ncbi:MAG: CDP-archaeol synthase [Akkermansiaceae bacterium]|nr:CDP-archaeol synthase [Akkermansiaceae bacterium]